MDPATKRPTVALDAFLGKSATSVKEEKNILNYDLNIYPNPFNPSTNIKFVIPERGEVSLCVYNQLGQKVRTLMNEMKDVGEYSIPWKGNDDSGKQVVSGVYFIQMIAGSICKSQKIILVK